jgi:hypothetical protein
MRPHTSRWCTGATWFENATARFTPLQPLDPPVALAFEPRQQPQIQSWMRRLRVRFPVMFVFGVDCHGGILFAAEAFDSIDTNPATDAVSVTVSTTVQSTQPPTASLSATTTQLREEKSQLKHRLRQFDIDFKAKHGRLPSKADKEVIRHLYKRYHDVKALLLGMEAASSSGVAPPHPTPSAAATAVTPTAARWVCTIALPRTLRCHDAVCAACVASAATKVMVNFRNPCASSNVKNATYRLVLTVLCCPVVPLDLPRSQRVCVQHHLRKFEEEFLKTHGRKVKYQKDIQPVAEDYQRYKVC